MNMFQLFRQLTQTSLITLLLYHTHTFTLCTITTFVIESSTRYKCWPSVLNPFSIYWFQNTVSQVILLDISIKILGDVSVMSNMNVHLSFLLYFVLYDMIDPLLWMGLNINMKIISWLTLQIGLNFLYHHDSFFSSFVYLLFIKCPKYSLFLIRSVRYLCVIWIFIMQKRVYTLNFFLWQSPIIIIFCCS